MPDRLGKYEIIRLLGQGSMGEVFLAKDPVLGREVAIKTIRPGGSFGQEAWARFRHEARVVGGLNHPNVVTVFDFGEEEDVHFLVMEFVPGKDLERLIREMQTSKADLLELLIQSLEGLAAAHAKKIVHRDLKPANILVRTEGRRWIAKLSDFGVAKTDGTALTQDGSFMGTLHYMAPEYLDKGKASPRTDLWALGVILYEIVSAGRKPWPGTSPGPILGGILKDPPAPLAASDWEGLPQTLRSVVRKALEKKPEARFQSAQEFATAIEDALSGKGAVEPAAPEPPPPPPPPPPSAAAADPRVVEALEAIESGTDTLLKVSKDGSGEWLSLRVALRVAPAGARVLVKPGTYRESLVVERDIHFVSMGPGEVVLQGGTGPAVTIEAGHATFEGFRFRNGSDDPVLLVKDGVLELVDARIESGKDVGLEVDGGAATILRTEISGGTGVGVRARSADLTMASCQVKQQPGGGLELDGGTHATLQECTFTGCGFAGVLALDGAELRAVRCRFEENEASGVHAHHGAKVNLEKCVLQGNRAYGVSLMRGAEARLAGCTLKNHRLGPVIQAKGAGEPVLEGCTLEGSVLQE